MSAPIIAAMVASIGLFGFGLWLIVYSIPKQNTKISIVEQDRKSTRLNSSHPTTSRMPSSA